VAEQQAVQALLDSVPKDYGLGLDGELFAPDGSELWFDVTMFHPTSAVRRKGQLKWHMERAEKESNAAAAGLALPGAEDQVISPAMAKAVKAKHDKNDPVVYTALLQQVTSANRSSRRRLSRIVVRCLRACLSSSSGSRATERAARKGGLMYDGRSPSRIAADFRRDLKDTIQVTAARIIGHYIAATGLCY
jgi:hypothetical protein